MGHIRRRCSRALAGEEVGERLASRPLFFAHAPGQRFFALSCMRGLVRSALVVKGCSRGQGIDLTHNPPRGDFEFTADPFQSPDADVLLPELDRRIVGSMHLNHFREVLLRYSKCLSVLADHSTDVQ